MTECKQIYRCSVCGNMVEVVNEAAGVLACCGKPMSLLKENTTDGAKEKHVPVIERIDGGYKVTVGSVEHPMTEAHHIQWIELDDGSTTMRKYLSPKEQPEGIFRTDAQNVTAREYCNLHGLWTGTSEVK